MFCMNLTRMHSSMMRTTHSLPYRGVFVHGVLCPRGSPSRGLCLGVSVQGRVSVQGVSVQRESLSWGGSVQRLSVQGVTVQGYPLGQRPPFPYEQNDWHACLLTVNILGHRFAIGYGMTFYFICKHYNWLSGLCLINDGLEADNFGVKRVVSRVAAHCHSKHNSCQLTYP